MRYHARSVFGWLAILTACGQPPADAAPDDVLFAGADSVGIWAPGLFSTVAPEFATTFTPDGGAVYFNRASPDRSQLVIMESVRRNGQWSEPAPASFSGAYRDVDPFVAVDGQRIYFSSDRPLQDGDTTADFNTWYADRAFDGWTDPQPLPEPVNSAAQETFVSLDRQRNLYFASDRDGTQRVYRSRWSGTRFETPELVAFDLNLADGAGNPMIDPAGTMLVVVAVPRDGSGGADLHAACQRAGEWTAADNLGPVVNSAYADFAPAFSPDGRYLVFTSERPGMVPESRSNERPPGDLYYVALDLLNVAC